MVTPPPQQFCVRWNSYQSNLQNAFPKLLTSEHFVDVTLACENEMLKCHKVVLSACSTYFEKLLLQNPCQHPIIFMKDMKFQEMQSLVDFMYKGEVNVTQDDLPSLLKSAEALQIRGLCGSDQLLNQQNLNNIKTPLKLPANGNHHQEKSIHSVNAKASSDQHSLPQQHLHHSQQHHHQGQTGQQILPKVNLKVKEEKTEHVTGETGLNPSSSECDSNDALTIKEDLDQKEEFEDSYYDGDGDIMDTEFTEEDGHLNTTLDIKTPDYAIANVSCQYDGSPGSTSRRVRRSDEELRRAAECITRGQTFQTIHFHNPSELPNINTDFLWVPLNQQLSMAVKPDYVTTKPNLREYDVKARHCYFDDERKLRFFKNYTQKNCELECLSNYTYKRCGCVAYYMPHDISTKVCGSNSTKIWCVDDAENNMLLDEFRKNAKTNLGKQQTLACNCHPACTSLNYNVELSHAHFNWGALVKALVKKQQVDGLDAFWGVEPGASFTRVKIFFKFAQFISTERCDVYDTVDFLACCGGLFGLFIGLSTVSVIETVYFITLRLYCNIWRYGNRFWSGSKRLIEKYY